MKPKSHEEILQVRGITPFGKDKDGIEWQSIVEADWATYYENNSRPEVKELKAWLEDKKCPQRIRNVINLIVDLFDRVAAWNGRIEVEARKAEDATRKQVAGNGTDKSLILDGLKRVMLCDSLRSLATTIEYILSFNKDEIEREQSAERAQKRSHVAESCREDLEKVNMELKACKKKQMDMLEDIDGQVNVAIVETKEYGEKISEIFDRRLEGHSEHIKLLGDCNDVTNELLYMQSRMLQQRDCGCIIFPKRKMRSQCYQFLGVLVVVGCLYAFLNS